jgi:hypothetical protein
MLALKIKENLFDYNFGNTLGVNVGDYLLWQMSN